MAKKKPTTALERTSQATAVELQDIARKAEKLIEASEAVNTRLAHRKDWARFEAWCKRHRCQSLPASPQALVAYLSAHAGELKPATLIRHLASISVAHRAAGFDSPTRSLLVGKTLAGIKRTHGTAQTKKAPLLVEELLALARALDTEELEDLRDRALILIMFAAALRRSEAADLEVRDIEFTKKGLILTKRRSKTDQAGAGMRVPVAYGSTNACPVIALRRWFKAAKLEQGAIFRDVTGSVVGKRLTDHTLARIVKRRVEILGLDPKKFSGHSLRAGFVTSASAAGMDDWMIAKITGHKSMSILAGYRREADIEVGEFTKRIGL